MRSVKPQARTNRLVTRDLGDELLVYDLERHKAFCLNQVARQVFRHCDGQTTIRGMAVRIGKALGVSIDEETIRLGLARLANARLLDGGLDLAHHSSRREMLRTLGRAAVVVTPLVTALTVPMPAQAVSCASHPCTPTTDCGNPSLCKCNNIDRVTQMGTCGPKFL